MSSTLTFILSDRNDNTELTSTTLAPNAIQDIYLIWDGQSRHSGPQKSNYDSSILSS